MTQRDRWARRPVVLRYFAFRDAVRASGIQLPASGWHVVFVLPMPRSWSKAKRAEHDGQPHRARPDLDNLLKALLDALYGEACGVWDGRATKIWGAAGGIAVG
jgi:hypothetical protein